MKKAVRVPEERIGVIKAAMQDIEKRTKTSLHIEGNVVSLEGDGLQVWIGADVVKAIARGFSPTRAYELLGEKGKELMIIDLSEHFKTKKARERIKGRIIGSGGKTRRIIEDLTGTAISVFGKTVSLIGTPESLEKAKKAIQMLVSGAKHATVYRYLERKR